MRVYFLSYKPAILKLNGLYAGGVDAFERRLELNPDDKLFAEFVPGENLQPVNFFLDRAFFSDPPAFADVYRLGGDALIYIREYGNKDAGVKVILQTRFCGNLVTVFSQGGIYITVEGENYLFESLPPSFATCSAQAGAIGGLPVLIIRANGRALILSEKGKIIFLNSASLVEAGETLKIYAEFETCTAARAECEYVFDGTSLKLIKSRTVETRPPEKGILHFAFFESVLCRGDCEKYLTEQLKPRAGELSSYLGGFVGVTVPTEKFYAEHGNIPAAGLVYPLKSNLFDVRYFAVDFEDDKISNVYPVH